MNKKTIITTLLAIVAMAGQGQTKVTGHVVNELIIQSFFQ